MKLEAFIPLVLEKAAAEGLEAAEIYAVSGSSFECEAVKGEIGKYAVNTTAGLSLRGIFEGKMGYAATEALDEAAIMQLINGVKESALCLEDEDEQDIYPGAKDYPQVNCYEESLDQVEGPRKLEAALEMEKAVLNADPRIKSVIDCVVATESSQVHLANTYGLHLTRQSNMAVMVAYAMAQEGESKAAEGEIAWSRNFETLDPGKIGEAAARRTLEGLNASPVSSGVYRVILSNEAMASLLATFSGIFSADAAQQGLSLLKGKEGQAIASAQVTLIDDPLLLNGLASKPFDAEGVPTRTKELISGGTLTTLLHNRKTARKQGCMTTGNASKAGYAAPVRVAPTNLFFKPGDKDLKTMMENLQEGLVITSLSGLHSGADPVSGDFSLLSKGYTVEKGKRGRAVEQITIAGNFYRLLENIRAVGCDLVFPGRSIGSPSVDIGEISVAGK